MKVYTDGTIMETEELNAYYNYLDALRVSGVTNMFGAAPYLEKEFGITGEKARQVLKMWMESFERRHG